MRSVNRGTVIKPGDIDIFWDAFCEDPVVQTKQGIRNLLYEGYAKECKYCGNTFKSSSGNCRYCSEECIKAAKNQRSKDRRNYLTNRKRKDTCAVCVSPITQTKGKPTKYCSAACKQKAYRQRLLS